MKEYHKINSIYKRDRNTGKFIIGDYSRPEFEYLCDSTWQFEEKLDGTNIRIHVNISEAQEVSILFGGRTSRAQIPQILLNKLNDLVNTESIQKGLPDFKGEFTLYGEGVGWKIQKGGLGYIPNHSEDKNQNVDFVLFDVRIGHFWQPRENVYAFAEQLGLRNSVIIGQGHLGDAIELCRKGFKSQLREQEPEGLIMRPVVELLDRKGQRIISKATLRDWYEGAN